MVETLGQLDCGEITPQPQVAEGVTYASKIDKQEARIDWNKPAREVDWHIRGLSPFPGAWCEIAGERVKVLMSAVESGSGRPGAACDDALLIACGEGAIRLTRLQRAGKAGTDARGFLNGFAVPKGTRLS